MSKYLADLKEGSMQSVIAIVQMGANGKVSIKLVGYQDVIVSTPTKRDFSKIELIEEAEEQKNIEEGQEPQEEK